MMDLEQLKTSLLTNGFKCNTIIARRLREEPFTMKDFNKCIDALISISDQAMGDATYFIKDVVVVAETVFPVDCDFKELKTTIYWNSRKV